MCLCFIVYSTFPVCSVAISQLSLVFDFDNSDKTVYTVCFSDDDYYYKYS